MVCARGDGREFSFAEARENIAGEMLLIISLAALSYERRPLLQDPLVVILANGPALPHRLGFRHFVSGGKPSAIVEPTSGDLARY